MGMSACARSEGARPSQVLHTGLPAGEELLAPRIPRAAIELPQARDLCRGEAARSVAAARARERARVEAAATRITDEAVDDAVLRIALVEDRFGDHVQFLAERLQREFGWRSGTEVDLDAELARPRAIERNVE